MLAVFQLFNQFWRFNFEAVFLLCVFVLFRCMIGAQNVARVHVAYMPINIQMTPIDIINDLDLARPHGLDAKVPIMPIYLAGDTTAFSRRDSVHVERQCRQYQSQYVW